jgi:hypothetical protein
VRALIAAMVTIMTARPSAGARAAFPPVWKVGMSWRVEMRTERPALPRDQGTPLVLSPLVFSVRVIEVPGRRSDHYTLAFHCEDEDDRDYKVIYRRDFSVARVERDGQLAYENADQPFVDNVRYKSRVIADFPYTGKPEVVLGDARLVQEVHGSHITLQHVERSGAVRIELEWSPGDPWWSTIECREGEQLVATGQLLR